VKDPWRHVLEHAIWTVAIPVLAMAAFFLRGTWPPLAFPARLLGTFYGATFSMMTQGGALAGVVGAGVVGDMVSFAVCTWAWLTLPLLLAIWIMQWIRPSSRRPPQQLEATAEPSSGMTFAQAFPAHLAAVAISTGWVAVVMAHIGFMRYAYDAKEGIVFALFALPLAVLPLALMALRRAVPAAWRRFKTRRV
jgi:hypothetical protein